MRAVAIPLAILIAGCQQAPEGTQPVTEVEALKIVEAAEADYSSGDTSKIMSHYADRVVAFDTGRVEPTADRKVLEGWTGAFVSMQPAGYLVSNRSIQLTGPDSFVNSGIARFSVAAGQARPQVGARFTQVYQRQKDGQFRIVHEHMSLPPTPPGAIP